MFGRPSMMTRVAVGKGIGFVIGLAGLITLPYFVPDAGWLPRWGLLFWYTTFGAVIGVMGVGGLIAVVGGLLFLGVVASIWWQGSARPIQTLKPVTEA